MYLDDYHIKLNKELGFKDDASLMISEIYVPRNDLAEFMMDVRKVALKENYDIIYGTIRLIKVQHWRELFELGERQIMPHLGNWSQIIF